LQNLYRILWSLVILFIIVTTVIFSFGILLVFAAVGSLYGLYRYYFGKKRSGRFTSKTTPRGYASGEIIDMPVENTDKPDKYLKD
jgi:hypothetical protein